MHGVKYCVIFDKFNFLSI